MTSEDKFNEVTNGAFSQVEQHMGTEMYQQQVEQAKQGTLNMQAFREHREAKIGISKAASARKNALTRVLILYLLLFLPALMIYIYKLVL